MSLREQIADKYCHLKPKEQCVDCYWIETCPILALIRAAVEAQKAKNPYPPSMAIAIGYNKALDDFLKVLE